MPRREQYVPKHRGPGSGEPLKKGIRKSFVFSGIAVAATGIAVSSGIAVQDDAVGDDSTAALSAAQDARDNTVDPEIKDRGSRISRSSDRDKVDATKERALSQASGGQETRTEDLSDEDPRSIARAMLPRFGFSEDQFACLDSLYMSESGWNPQADNPTSSAYGIPQALTGGTHELPADYMTNPASQIKWGLEYIQSSYGSPCSAWSFKQSHNWY